MIAGAHTGTKFNDPLAIIALSPPFVTLLDNYGLRKHSVLKKHISIEIFFSQMNYGSVDPGRGPVHCRLFC